jgi:hypothetical protein
MILTGIFKHTNKDKYEAFNNYYFNFIYQSQHHFL